MILISEDTSTEIKLIGEVSIDYIAYEKFLGDWNFIYNNGSNSVQVKITEGSPNSSLILTGLGDYGITLGYSERTNKLSMVTQYLGLYGNIYYVYLCPWDCDTGYVTWSSGVGFDLVFEEDENGVQLIFQDNQVWSGYSVSGLLLYLFSSSTPSSFTVLGYILQYPYTVSM